MKHIFLFWRRLFGHAGARIWHIIVCAFRYTSVLLGIIVMVLLAIGVIWGIVDNIKIFSLVVTMVGIMMMLVYGLGRFIIDVVPHITYHFNRHKYMMQQKIAHEWRQAGKELEKIQNPPASTILVRGAEEPNALLSPVKTRQEDNPLQLLRMSSSDIKE